MKKKEQKKQIQPCLSLLSTQPYWTYTPFDPQQILKIDAFFNSFDKEIKLLLKESVIASVKDLSSAIGIHPHSIFSQKSQQQLKSMFNLSGYRFDYASLRVILYIIQLKDVSILKFTNNCFDSSAIKAIQSFFSSPQNKLSSFTFDWNPLDQYPMAHQFFARLVNSKLEKLTLRSCKLGQNAFQGLQRLCENSSLKSIDLFDNILGSQSVGLICKVLRKNKSLTQIGLAKNNISKKEQLQSILRQIGMVELSAGQVEQYFTTEKLREQITERNKKRKKGTPEEPLPPLQKVVNENGKYFVERNLVLESISLSNNGLWDSAAVVEGFLQRNQKCQLIFSGNFGPGEGQKIAGKYQGRLLV